MGSKYLLPGIKGSSKTYKPSTAQLLPIVRFMTKQNSIWSKALIMPLTIWNCVCLINRIIIPVFFQEITFTTEFLGSNFLLPTCCNRGQMGFSEGKFATCYC